MVSHWSLSGRKSPQVSRTLLSILANLSNAVVWRVSTRPLISKSSIPYINHLVTLLSAPITIGITVTFMFHSFFQFSSKVQILITLFAFLQFFAVFCWNGKVRYSVRSLFFSLFFFSFFSFLTITWSGRIIITIIIIISFTIFVSLFYSLSIYLSILLCIEFSLFISILVFIDISICLFLDRNFVTKKKFQSRFTSGVIFVKQIKRILKTENCFLRRYLSIDRPISVFLYVSQSIYLSICIFM